MEKKIILCKNYDDIRWFDGTYLLHTVIPLLKDIIWGPSATWDVLPEPYADGNGKKSQKGIWNSKRNSLESPYMNSQNNLHLTAYMTVL